MKNTPTHPADPTDELSEDDVRAYAFHLYEQSGCAPGHDLDNWLEASACLKANIPAHKTRTRLHSHVYGPETSDRYRKVSSLGS